MNYRVFKNDEQLNTQCCKIFPKPYNSFGTMEYVMLTIKAPTELVIESEEEIREVVIRPLSAEIPAYIRDEKIHVTIDRPMTISVEINGRCENNLMIFVQDREYSVPEQAENLIVLKKDDENTGTLTADKDNTVIYMEEGAVLYGNIRAEGCENLTICGLGKICMERYTYEMRKDYARSVDIIGCRNVVIDGIIIDDSNDWSMRINGCDNVNIKNVKIFGCRGNSDGIDVCGSRNVTVSNIFTRVWDDSFVVKALGTGNAENIIFKDSVLWNDFARPIEVGVELRADEVKNIRFENIDIIHSSTGYPLMGIHHGDHARVSDILFKNIRIEDAPGAQLFDIRIADSVWNRDGMMGDIRDITFSDIEFIGTESNDIPLSYSRVEGFCEEHDIRNIRFHNISINGSAVKNTEELGLDIYDYVSGVSVTSDLKLPEAVKLLCEIKEKNVFVIGNDGIYRGSVSLTLTNNTVYSAKGDVSIAVSPKNSVKDSRFIYNLAPGESAVYEFAAELQPGKYVFYIKNRHNETENKFLYKELDAVVYDGTDIKDCPEYHFVNYYNNRCTSVKIGVADGQLVILNTSEQKADFVIYTAEPVQRREGEVMFSAEETDFGEVCAFIERNGVPVPAPQLRCPAEITYVFKNEPKVKEIIKTNICLQSGGTAVIPLKNLGIADDAEEFLLELAAEADEVSGLRYPYTLFGSTMPEKTAHMFGKFRVIKER